MDVRVEGSKALPRPSYAPPGHRRCKRCNAIVPHGKLCPECGRRRRLEREDAEARQVRIVSQPDGRQAARFGAAKFTACAKCGRKTSGARRRDGLCASCWAERRRHGFPHVGGDA